MNRLFKYAVFETKWGYFGLAGTEKTLRLTCLPLKTADKVHFYLTNRLPESTFEADYAKVLQKQIIRYFETGNADFGAILEADMAGLTDFSRLVLKECRKIAPAQTIFYSSLAEKIGKPKAVRAVGTALAKNPLPLIIPCHRVIKKNGDPGNFSAGPAGLKLRLLSLERKRGP